MLKQWRFCLKLVREVLGLKFTNKKKSNREIARIHSIFKFTVATYLSSTEVRGIKTIEDSNRIDDEKLYSIICRRPVSIMEHIKNTVI
jgi:PAB1-binding protein PBP1